MPQNGSPEQIIAYANAQLHTLGAKLNTYDERYHAQSTPGDAWTPVLPSAGGVFQRYGIQSIARLGGGVQAGAAAPPSTVPLQKGDVKKLANGKTVVITAVHSDGSFDAK
jgi:hypothetical protein